MRGEQSSRRRPGARSTASTPVAAAPARPRGDSPPPAGQTEGFPPSADDVAAKPGITVLVAAANVVVRAGYQHILQPLEDIRVADQPRSALDLLDACRRLRPAVALVDLALRPAGGLEATRRIVAESIGVGVIVTAATADADLALRVIDAGAAGLVTFDTGPSEVADAIRRVASGGMFLEPALMQEVALRRVHAGRDALASLSSREFEVFRLLSAGKAVAEVARSLRLSPRSVANYQTSIKRKLGVSTAAELVHVAIRRGVVRLDEV